MNITSNNYIKNSNLKSVQTKKNIYQFLHKYVDSIQKSEHIKNIKDLDNIRDNDYIICPKLIGTRCWIIFCKFDNYYYAVNFSKYSKQINNTIIHPINVSVIKEFYDGTIMEGTHYRIDNKHFLVIDEVYLFAGQAQLLKPKDDRLSEMNRRIIFDNMNNSTYTMYISKFFQINKKSLQELYEIVKFDEKIKEIIFYPKIFGRKIYSYTIMDYDLVDIIIKLSKFQLQKTNNLDVYNLLSITTNNKIDIAYIPDMETSKKCKQWFKDSHNKNIIVKCQMDINKKKWIPIEIIKL
jgi:hypothetical protein